MKRSELHQVIGCLFANGEKSLAQKLRVIASGTTGKYAVLSNGREIKGASVDKNSSFYFKFSKDQENPKGLLVITNPKKESKVPANINQKDKDVYLNGTKPGTFVKIKDCSIKELRKKYNKIRVCIVSQ